MALKIDQCELSGGIHKIKLTGALDIEGAASAELPFSVVSGSQVRVIVDMSGVTFLASIGIRVFVMTARAINRRRGCFILFGTSEEVRRVLRSTGVDQIISSVVSEAEAIAACRK